MGTRFSARPDRPWSPPSLLYNGYRVFPGGRGGRGVGLTHHPHLECRGPRKSRAVPLLILRAFVACKKRAKTYLIVIIVLSHFQQRFSIVLNFIPICARLLYISFLCPRMICFLGTDQPPYILTPWIRVLLEKLTGSRVVKIFPAFYAPRRFITSFTTANSLFHVGQ